MVTLLIFFVVRKCYKVQKIDEVVTKLDEFQWGFKKNVTCDNLKGHKKTVFHIYLPSKYIFGKPVGEDQIDPSEPF